MKRLRQEELISSIYIDKNTLYIIGAGCSISSGCLSSYELVQKFKLSLYCTKHNISFEDIDGKFYLTELMNKVNSEYPDMDDNYSYYFEKCIRFPEDRNIFIKDNFINKRPSIGYLCFANYIVERGIKYIFTTNFDKLIDKSIREIDDCYNCVVVSDNLQPILSGDTTIVEMHGDYNYDALQNTKEELERLSSNVQKTFLSLNVNKIVVIGYSGRDNSVMSVLSDYLKMHNETKLYWCTLENEQLNLDYDLCDYKNFYNVSIKGFDELFKQYYEVHGKKNSKIDCILEEHYNNNLHFSYPKKQIEEIELNCFPLIDEPLIEEIKDNNEELNKTTIEYKGTRYGFTIASISSSNILLSQLKVPVNKKVELLKKYIDYYFQNCGLVVYKKTVSKNNTILRECLEYDIKYICGQLCLVLSPSYTYGREPIKEEIFRINSYKSNLYSIKNYNTLYKLISELLPSNLSFITKYFKFRFSTSALTTTSGLEDYSVIEEPNMVINDKKSTNQLMLVQNYGPQAIKFAPDKIRMGVICLDSKKFLLNNKFIQPLMNGSSVESKTELIEKFPGFKELTNIELSFVKNDEYILDIDKITNYSFNDMINWIMLSCESLYKKQANIILIFFSKEMEKFRFDNGNDFHDAVKHESFNKYKTQIIEEDTLLSNDDINKKLFNFSIALYTKIIGIPWNLYEFNKDNFYVGMSFGKDSKGICIGCSQLFDSGGRGLQLIASPVTDKYTKKPYLSKEEAYRLGSNIRKVYYRAAKPYDINQVTIHRTTPFRKDEIEGFCQAFKGINSFNLIQIIDYSSINGYARHNDNIYGYPIKRGTIIKIDRNTALIWTAGSLMDNDVMPGKNYRNSKRGIGAPIVIKKFYGKASIEELSSDILRLTKMDFNSSDVLFSKFPVTLKYAKTFCRIIKNTGNINYDDLINFEYIM